MRRPILGLIALLFALTASPAYSLGGPLGQAFVRDDRNYSDKVTLTMIGMPATPRDNVYEAWLATDNGIEQTSLGNLKVEPDGTARLSVTREDNFVARYNKVTVSLEPRDNEDPKQAGKTVMAGEFPLTVITHLRHLLVHFPEAPGGTALAIGLRTQASLMLKYTNLAAAAAASGDLGKAKENAEAVVNVVDGSRGPHFGDLDKDGLIQNPGDGYGLLGYVDKLVEHTGMLSAAEGATPEMAMKASAAETAANNVGAWAKQVRDDAALLVLEADSVDGAKPLLEEMARKGIPALNGVDADSDGLIEPVEGEGGAMTAYTSIQSIARYHISSLEQAILNGQTGTISKEGDGSSGETIGQEVSGANPILLVVLVLGLLGGASFFAILALLWARSRASMTRQ